MQHSPRKRFGQNFLHDPFIIRRILSAIAPAPTDRLVEIGPGQGAITTGLLAATGSLDAIELDRDLIAPLTARCKHLGHLRVHNADALSIDLCSLAVGAERLRVIGNLPYNISTPLLFKFLEQADCIQDMHFMLQREVVERITAAPGSKVYGRLSVMVQAYCSATALFVIGPGAFQPAPKVDSAFLRLVPHRPLQVPIQDAAALSQLVARAFAQRRKTLRNSLKGLASADLMTSLGIDPGKRAEELDVATFIELANAACKSDFQT